MFISTLITTSIASLSIKRRDLLPALVNFVASLIFQQTCLDQTRPLHKPFLLFMASKIEGTKSKLFSSENSTFITSVLDLLARMASISYWTLCQEIFFKRYKGEINTKWKFILTIRRWNRLILLCNKFIKTNHQVSITLIGHVYFPQASKTKSWICSREIKISRWL